MIVPSLIRVAAYVPDARIRGRCKSPSQSLLLDWSIVQFRSRHTVSHSTLLGSPIYAETSIDEWKCSPVMSNLNCYISRPASSKRLWRNVYCAGAKWSGPQLTVVQQPSRQTIFGTALGTHLKFMPLQNSPLRGIIFLDYGRQRTYIPDARIGGRSRRASTALHGATAHLSLYTIAINEHYCSTLYFSDHCMEALP